MEAPDRSETELELAAALLLLWLLFEDIRLPAQAAYQAFLEGFNRTAKPILIRIYGRARAALADAHGNPYPVRPAPSGQGQTILIPSLNRRVDQYAADLYETFQRRQAAAEEEARSAPTLPEQDQPADPKPVFGPADADRIAITETTRIHSEGEMDAAKDVESRTGKRLVAMWVTERDSRVCPICSPLDGTIREWRSVFPGGPPGHFRCRCSLQWREFLG